MLKCLKVTGVVNVSQSLICILSNPPLAFDQTGGVLELQSRVVDSPLTGKLLGVTCEFLVLDLLYGRNNLAIKQEIIS